MRSNYNEKFTPSLIIKLYKTVAKVANAIPKPKIFNLARPGRNVFKNGLIKFKIFGFGIVFEPFAIAL